MYFETSDFKERTSAANASDLDTEKKQQLGKLKNLVVKNLIVLDQWKSWKYPFNYLKFLKIV